MDMPPVPDSSQIITRTRKYLQGACDQSRKRKAKCNSAEMPDNVCSNCIISKIQCSHDAPRQTKTSQNNIQIQTLGERLEKLMEYIRKHYPEEDLDSIMNQLPGDDTQPGPDAQDTFTFGNASAPGIDNASDPNITTTQEGSQVGDDDDLAYESLRDHFVRMGLKSHGRFFGQSSSFMFVKHASMVKTQVQLLDDGENEDPWSHRRPIFWKTLPWEKEYGASLKPDYIYPPDELLTTLVSLYFEKINSILPVLHQPTFLNALQAGLHLSHRPFGMTVLLVCALGSRHSQDPRVRTINDESGLSSGWHYFSQVPIYRSESLFEISTYDLQYYALAALYLIGTSMPHASWILLGIGMRFAFEKGAHRRTGDTKPSAEVELQKRAFWAIVCLDRFGSAFVGRPYGYQHEVFDVEYPIECDDIYWDTEDPEKAFQQPPGIPSSITSFVCLIKLCEILAFALRTLYANRKLRVSSGFVGNKWEARMVAELDSSMNQWKDSLPDHLRWDAEYYQDPMFLYQSANLHATYYYIQIQIHRPFLSRNSSLSFVSLAMCTNAARSISHILETIMEKELRVLPILMVAALTAGIFIVMGLKSGPSSKYTYWNPTKDKENLNKCMEFLKQCAHRWPGAERMNDMLIDAADLRNHPSTNSSLSAQHSTPSGEYISAEDDSTEFSPMMDLQTAGTNPLDDWELQQLFLRELGYPMNSPSEVNLPESSDGNLLLGQESSASLLMASDLPGFPSDISLLEAYNLEDLERYFSIPEDSYDAGGYIP